MRFLLALWVIGWSSQVNGGEPPCVLFSPVQTQHVSTVNRMSYTATVGLFPIYDLHRRCIASMSYIAYTKDSDEKNRPLTFISAGGPGASSLTDNFLASGPKIIPLNTQGGGSLQSILQDNPETWLAFTDLVYIDMIGTGWGRVVDPADAKTIFTPEGDADAFSQFILSYLSETKSFNKKIYLMGESYGGFRAALLMSNLLKHFVSLEGLILVSPLLDQDFTRPSVTRIVDYALFIPTFTRAALYHGRLSKSSPATTVQTATDWATTTYLNSLVLGDEIPPAERDQITSRLSEYTGLSKTVIKEHNNRITLSLFRNNLIDGKVIDYIDSRVTDRKLTDDYGFYVFRINSFFSGQLVMYPKAMENVLIDLNVKTSAAYINYFSPEDVWHHDRSTTNAISILRNNLIISPKTKVFVGSGYYDIDIPYSVTKTAIAQLFLPASIRQNISLHYYPAGHMFYTDPAVRKPFYEDIKSFYSK